jgi:general secretion pathway protein K
VRRINPLAILKSQRGIAMLIALFALMLMIFIAMEVSYDSTVEYVVASQEVNRVKSYYAAKSGLELGFLRVQLYKAAMVQLGSMLGPQKNMLDMIWQFPMSWPPIFPDTVKVTEVDKDMVQSSVKDSLMEAQYATTIEPESGKININDLGSPVKTMQQAVRNQLAKIFDTEMRNNDTFKRKYSNINFDEVINNIYDWISTDTVSANGGDKKARYQDFDLKDTNKDFIPPGRPFKTLDEMHMVAGMKDDFFKLLEPRITVYGVPGLNVNYAPKEMLMALDVTFTEEAANAVMKRRMDPKEGGPFPSGQECASTFLNYVAGYGVNVRNIQDLKINLICDPEYNFRVTSTGTYQRSKREITAVTFDIENLATVMATLLNQQDQQNGTNPGLQPSTTNAAQQGGAANNNQQNQTQMKPPKGRPIVVYWDET